MELNLSFFTILSSAICILLLYLFILLIRTFAGKSIRNPQFPPVYGTAYGTAFYMSKIYDQQTEIAKKLRTFRLVSPANSEIYTTDPRNIEHILKTRFEIYTKGIKNMEIMRDLFGDGIFAADGENWKQQRKLASYEFSTRILRDFSCSIFRRNAVKLFQTASQFSSAGRVFNIQDLLMRFTMNSIFKVGFGVDLNCLDYSSNEGGEFMKAVDDANSLLIWRYVDPFWKLKRLLNIGSEASLKKNIKTIDDLIHRVIKNKRSLLHDPNFNEKEDILSRFVMESEKDPTKMDDRYIRDIVFSFLLAGKDTTAGTVSWFFYMLCKNPLIQQKVAQEVREIVGVEDEEEEGCDINAFMEKLTDSALEKMHYLHATLSETLRLYPAVPVDGRSAEVDDILPDGYRVKKGDEVSYMSYAMGRMPYLWGEDAEDFKPERWLKNEIFQPESPFKFISFHAGPRICLGKEFAYRQMKIICATLLQFFRFKLADETKNVTYSVSLTLPIDGGLPVLAVPRRKSA